VYKLCFAAPAFGKKTTNAINLSGLLPQVNASGNAIHYFQQSQLGASTTTGTANSSTTTSTSKSGALTNTFIPQLSATQNIFNPALAYTAKSAPLYVKAAQQVTDSTKIGTVANTSKSFFNLLLTLEQINVLAEDTARLGKNVRDTYHQYKGGIVDETDYEEAVISLNNSLAQLKQAKENVVPQYATLKQAMGFPPDSQFNVDFDTTEMIKHIGIDTTLQLQYEKRIEFQALQTQKKLQHVQTDYYRMAFLPTVSAFFNYNYGFGSNSLSTLFNTGYPSSLIGLSLSVPIFTGFSRVNNVKKSRLEEESLQWDEFALKSQINVEYTTALANYKGNLFNMAELQKNVALAKRTYFVVNLQYKQGIIPYLNVITAESNLITSEISYINALFQVLSNKVDLEKSMGTITY
jgi:outer membrane protein TolC